MTDRAGVRSSRGLRMPGFIALLMVAAAVWFVLRTRNVESLIPVVTESRIDLLTRLDTAQQLEGFPPRVRWLDTHVFPDVNLDDDAIPILMPATGRIGFPDLPIHDQASLTFRYGIEAVAPADPRSGAATDVGEGVSVAFEVRIGADEASARSIFRESVRSGVLGDPPKRQTATVAIPPEYVGQRVTLYFATASEKLLPELVLLPAFASPVLVSKGVKARVGELTLATQTLIADLLALHRDLGAIPASGAVFAKQRVTRAANPGKTEEIEVPTLRAIRVPSFDAARKFEAERWGAWPSLAFGGTGKVAEYQIEVPSGDVRLEFEIGLDRRCIGVGAAGFAVEVDGESVYSRTLDPSLRADDAGWHEVSVPLAKYAGRRVVLTLHGEVEAHGVRTLRDSARDAFDREVVTEWEVRAVQAAFARPRVVRHETVPRRLSAKKDPARPSVVFVTIETLRADALGCYGSDSDCTPTIDRLAAQGVRVAPCISVAPWTGPSVASTFTGLYPYAHGVISYAQSYLAGTVETLAERASGAGVTTAAFVTNDVVSRRTHFDQGFELFQELTYANASQVVGAFEHWLADHADLQFFAYLHLFEPHDPCNAPGEDRERYVPDALKGQDDRAALARLKEAIAENRPLDPASPEIQILRGRYLGEVRYVDRQIERLWRALEAKGLLGRVVLVITSDHGEEFGEHGLIGHGSHCYEESVSVPLVLFGPGHLPAGMTIDGPVESTAMYATTLGLLGVEYDAKAVEPPLRFDGDGGYGGAYSSTEQGLRSISLDGLRTMTIHRLQTRGLSLVFSPRGEEPGEGAQCAGFDLRADPGEHENVLGKAGLDFAALRESLRAAWEFAHAQAHGIATDHVDAATQAALEQLGYAAGARSNAAGALFGPNDDCGTQH